MKQFIQPKPLVWNSILSRPTASFKDLEPVVEDVFSEVQSKGDEALKAYTQKFDGVSLDSFSVTEADFLEAENKVSKKLKEAIQLAKSNIEAFHKAQKTPSVSIETQPGVLCWQEKRPIEKVGLYIPGGSAPLFSTLLMLAIPAQIAGCKEIVLCTPPDQNGAIPDVILYTAKLCGLSQIFKLGGIQAIAAMTFGTETVPKVYKIFGPGNQYVTVAKQIATQYQVSIDMPAGPSELLVVADETANPAYVASDLLSQAEHGADSQVILVTTYAPMLELVKQEIEIQLNLLPRKEIAEKAMDNSRMIFFETNEESIDFINQYGPEHYIICVKEEQLYIDQITNAGSVFIGNYTPESAGDYASGTNHTLPTNGYAKQYSGVNLDSYLKQMTFQKISSKGIQNIGPAIELMAESEGLQAHKNAVTLRLNDLKDD
ncbi:MAG: histidinol dehydrogenase [Flavobacteriaceae bacterium]|jgi:histidinol dehydrogenase|nr:histidinol dehydrogenase [Flavobacteriaceae bacterium]